MASKSAKKAINAPIRIWMVDIPGGYIEISDLYIWVHLRNNQREMKYRIDGAALFRVLKNIDERYTFGKLDFWSHRLGENSEKLIVIEPAEDEDFDFSFEVAQKELYEALYYFVG